MVSDKITKRCHSHHRASLEAGACCCRSPEKHCITPGPWSMGRSWTIAFQLVHRQLLGPFPQCTGSLYANPGKSSQLQANRNLFGVAEATDHEGCSLDSKWYSLICWPSGPTFVNSVISVMSRAKWREENVTGLNLPSQGVKRHWLFAELWGTSAKFGGGAGGVSELIKCRLHLINCCTPSTLHTAWHRGSTQKTGTRMISLIS